MQRITSVSRWCERTIEASWLLALTIIPLYFNLYSARHFEPDKIAMLRSLALLAATALLIRMVDRLITQGRGPQLSAVQSEEQSTPPSLWQRLRAIPLAIPVLVYVGVYILTTLTSVVPWTSLWGSYQRMQGTYTALSYIMLGVAIVAVVRQREQVERIISMSMITATAVASYGLLQHQGLDPLPWQGDVVTRITSSMGNAIFVAAYMIMVVPLALYRLVAAATAVRTAPVDGRHARIELLWTLARLLLFIAGATLILAMVKFEATIRTIDQRYWWLMPGSLSCATALWWLLSRDFDRPGHTIALWPGLMMLGYLLTFGIVFASSAMANVQAFTVDGRAVYAQDWWIWLLGASAAATGSYGLALLLPKRPAQPTRLSWLVEVAAAGGVTLVVLVAIVFTQSRGPWVGLGLGLMLFISLLLWEALRYARTAGSPRNVLWLRAMLIGWGTLISSTVIFLLVFNLSQAPIFERLRELPYIGRLGSLTANEGSGRVRVLIWIGDEHAGGSVGLIRSNPLRTLIGWGPESMFVAYNPFFPPSLTEHEVMGASPDRAHQAQLDELVTKGVLGLASYLFLLLSFLLLCWRLMRQSSEWRWKVFFIACMSAIVSHVGEGLTGIPVVSTLMMFWITIGLVVAAGAVAGHYWQKPLPERTVTPSPTSRQEPGARRRGGAVRGLAQRSGGSRRSNQPVLGHPLLYALIAGVALFAIMLLNVNPVRADMRFHQTQSSAEQSNLAGLTRALTGYLETIRIAPREDIYYINVGRTLMSLADLQRTQGREVNAPTRNVRFEELLQLNSEQEVVAFIQREPPANLLSFADAVLQRARTLNPLNKDHYANLGRLHSYWYRMTQDRAQLLVALDWYKQAGSIAPQDVSMINEWAGILMILGELERNSGNSAQADDYAMQANNLLRRSAELDEQYVDTFIRLGDLLRQAYGDLDGAVSSYSQAIMLSGRTVAGSIESIATALSERPDLILRLRDAYVAHISARTAVSGQQELALLHAVAGLLAARGGEATGAVEAYQQATALEPTNPIYSRNYALVLSDTLRYDEAIVEAQRMAALLRNRSGSEQSLSEVEYLITILEQVRGR